MHQDWKSVTKNGFFFPILSSVVSCISDSHSSRVLYSWIYTFYSCFTTKKGQAAASPSYPGFTTKTWQAAASPTYAQTNLQAKKSSEQVTNW